MQKITPFLWFDKDAMKVAKFYASVFKDSKIINSTIMSDTPSGTVEIVNIELFGQVFTLMSAGPMFTFTEAISFVVDCKNQEELDYYWEKLTADGGQESMCGWLKDKYGLSWQIIPKALGEMMASPDKEKSGRATQAMLKMKKIVVTDLQKAFDGK